MLGISERIKDFIRFHLTGEITTEITEASSGCLVDLDTRQFEMKLFEILGIEDCYQKMPPIFESAEISGRAHDTGDGTNEKTKPTAVCGSA